MLVCTLICAMIATKFSCISFDLASAANNNEVYIRDIKLFEGFTAEAAKTSMERENYIPVKNGNTIIDFNKDAGTEDSGKSCPSSKVVYMGYRTTTDPDEAITDMAVMNMNGGYSVKDYDKMIKENMESKIIPFVKSFIATIEEYRKNYNSSNKKNKIRARNAYRILNRFSVPGKVKNLGDLLLNKTRYEMGEEKYKKLSSYQLLNHIDIVSIITEGNADIVSTVKKVLLMAADTDEKTWIQRMSKIDYEDLEQEAKAELEKAGIKATQSNIDKRLDSKYNDVAKVFLSKWDEFSKVASDYEDILNEYDEGNLVENSFKEAEKSFTGDEENVVEVMEYVQDKKESIEDANEKIKEVTMAEEASLLDEKKYGKGTLNDFFSQSKEELIKGGNIKKLYPMVAALSKGQRVGPELIEIKDLMDVGLGKITEYTDEQIKSIPQASVYQGVNRELFQNGNVAITDDALRKEVLNNSSDYSGAKFFKDYGIAVGVVLAVGALIMIGLHFMDNSFVNGIPNTLSNMKVIDELSKTSSSVFKYAGAFFAVASLVFIGLSIWGDNAYYDRDFATIPKYMIDRVNFVDTDKNGNRVCLPDQNLYYKVVESNRQGFGAQGDDSKFKTFIDKRYDEIGNRGDLNGTIGKEWLALYTVKNPFDAPILAGSLNVKYGNNVSVPSGYTPVHKFGSKNKYNLKKPDFIFGKAKPIYLFFKHASVKTNESKTKTSPGAAGTIVSGKNNVLAGGLGFIVGGIAGAFVVFASRKRKKKA